MDFEFMAPAGEKPVPVCLVAREVNSNRLIRQWLADSKFQNPPYATDGNSILVAYYASAEIGCHLALGWAVPQRVIDLYVEFRTLTNGLELPGGKGLLGALAYYGLDPMDANEKQEMRELAMRGGPYTDHEREALLDYCQTDVDALVQLLPRMLPRIDLPRALIRGRYMTAVARMENTGTPIDTDILGKLRNKWYAVKGELVDRIDADYGVFEGQSFKEAKFESYLVERGIPWPMLETGKLNLQDDAFRDMSVTYPEVAALRELRGALSGMRLNDLAVGGDGRNRCLLSPFAARTGRNQPSNAKFIFGPSRWMRSLIKPRAGRSIAYIDYSQQEFGIAAALSNDAKMKDAYKSGDPYLAFAKQAGAVPPDATKQSHEQDRARFKQCVLAVQYGMGDDALARKIKQSPAHARELLRLHRQTYRDFWAWSDAVEAHALIGRRLHTVFGWPIQYANVRDMNCRSARNFPVQGNGAEMLRLAVCLMTEAGIEVCAPVHDAVLVEGDTAGMAGIVADCRRLMTDASRTILDGFEIETDVKLVDYPNRYVDDGGEDFWNEVIEIMERV